jgi:Caspase domain
VEDEAVALNRIIWSLQSVRRLRLILLDACRDNPFVAKLQRSVGVRAAAKGGLAKIDDVSADTLVGYAAKAGSVSYDGDGANSPFASALLKHVAVPGLDIRIALGRVRDEVLKLTGGRQEPFIYGSLGGATIPLVPLPPAKTIEPAAVPPPAVAVPAPRPNAAVAPPEPNRVGKPVPWAGNPAPAKVEPAKAPQSNSQATLDKEDPALACTGWLGCAPTRCRTRLLTFNANSPAIGCVRKPNACSKVSRPGRRRRLLPLPPPMPSESQSPISTRW